MGTAKPIRGSSCVLLILYVAFSISYPVVYADERSLVIGQSTTLQLSPGLVVENSPGLKPGTKVFCERVSIHGLSRLRDLRKFAHTMKVKVLQNSSSLRRPNVEVCFHRNASLGVAMCSQGRWEKVSKGSWVQSMSPFDHKILDIRTAASSLEPLEVSIEEEFFLYRIVFLILGIILMSLASTLSKSLVFYYGSAMAVGVILVILMVLFQGMKLLPTGRKSSLAIFIYSSLIGLGSFLLRYLPGLFHSLLMEIGIGEDLYNPLAIFLVAFVVLAGAWLGFWVVHKLVLTEDGSIDISTSNFVAWSIRILAVIMILQSSLDPLLAAEALISGIFVSSILRKLARLRFLRRVFKKLFKLVKNYWRHSQVPDLSPFKDSYDEYMYKSPDDFKFVRRSSKHFSLTSCNSSKQGITRSSPRELSDSEIYPSAFHNTPERRKFSKEEWQKFTRDSTKRAVEDLVSSPDFSKWVATNADRITVTPSKASPASSVKRRKWFLLF
ncbi:nuclear envelope integral membrane protein 1 isoform X1 [Melia azedarach]|uniref:Nuclear envelope integral membrane protein 1 isoform X1 n=1 Tax=Melia azedarach TaxID=155640 RepID=A0ACC1XWN9_MELAZ|nr:nuclear envelope integral membrane protein 1 isoform X1 [Melia azedarach]